MPILAEVGIQSLSSLSHFEGDERKYSQLKEQTRSISDKKLLLQLLKIDYVRYKINSLLQKIKSLEKKGNYSEAQVEEGLQHILETKSDIESEGLYDAFVKILSNSDVEEYLKNIMLCNFQSTNIKIFMEDIIDGLDKSVQVSQLTQSISNWLLEPFDEKKICNFSTFSLLLENLSTSEDWIRRSKICKLNSEQALGRCVSEALYYYRHNYKNTHEDIFIIIIMHPFLHDIVNDVVTLKPLLFGDLKLIKKYLDTQKEFFDVYCKKSLVLLQAYLLLLALNICNGKEERVFVKQVYYAMLDFSRDPCITDIGEAYFAGCSAERIKENLYDLIYPPCQGRDKELHIIHSDSEVISKDKVERLLSLAYRDDEFIVMRTNPEAHLLFEELKLCKYYHNKLKLKDALCVRENILELSLNNTAITDASQLPFLTLLKLNSYDSRCRANLLRTFQLPQKANTSLSTPQYESDSELEENEEFEDQSFLNTSGEVENGIHPLDCILAVLLCADSCLTQDLLSRLAMCQFSVPLILPDPFKKKLCMPLWAMSSIIKEWKSIEDGNQAVSHVSPIIKHPMPVITFIRIGKHCRTSLSKSKILNDVISDDHHDYFFHRDCPGGQYKTILGRGLVDMCWYLPSGKPADSFPNVMTFLNLHGDAREYEEQCSFLSNISSMCIALVTEEDLHSDDKMITCLNYFQSLPGGILVLNCNGKPLKGLKKVFPKVEIYSLMNSEIKEAIRLRVKAKLSELNSSQCIEDLCHQARGSSIELDEDSVAHQQGSVYANQLVHIISNEEQKACVKDITLPLQGEHLWKVWAYYEKELHRHIKKGNETIYEYSAKTEREQDKIRNSQLEHVHTLTPLMKLFITSLIELGTDDLKGVRNHFLQYLKMELNSLSRENISQTQNKYQSVRKELSKLQAESYSQRPEVKTEIAKLKNELEELQEEIINSSLGLEHMFRELGQVYEAALYGKIRAKSTALVDDYIHSLPKVAAGLLIEGYPFEIMDGDAAHVPLQWVKAVIKEAVALLDDPNVFVLSVIGLQSTGKSTMLNATFGLQFNVSAGRCTRGAFMQLLPLDEDLRTKTKCSYVIIVDTEGLRAPELDPTKTRNHDNELATFVIGLANMTLINIYGEVPGDIDDILQISVHAFLRMSRVKYYPSCQFVHQNAGVNIKGEVSRAKFTQKLNRFTTNAAREEHFDSQYETFNDVIKFDDQTDVHYFPGLWKGDPPMAPVNEGYSHTAQSLKMQLIQNVCKRASLQPASSEMGKLGDLSLSSFYVKIGDLWKTLLKEKFVFSFKNTLEIKAYNALEFAYYTWGWRFKSAMLVWEQKAENEILTEPYESLTTKVEQTLRELREYVSSTQYEPLREEMEEFFNGKQSEILIQWKAKFEIRLESLSRELQSHAEDHCNNLFKNRQAIYGFETDRQKSVDFIKKKVQEHIEAVKMEQQNLQKSLERKALTSEQLKPLLARNLFNPEQLSQLEEDRTFTANQVINIKSIIRENGLNEKSLKIIFERELEMVQVKIFLKRAQQTEEELRSKFEKIWEELINQLPTTKSSNLSVTHEVEQALYSFVESDKGYHGQLIGKLKEKKFDMRNSDMTLTLEKNRHFHPKNSVKIFARDVSRYIWGTSDQYEIEAIEINKKVFDKAKEYLATTQSKNTAFDNTFVSELLDLVRDTIRSLSKHKDYTIIFTTDYHLDVYIAVCSYSVPIFEVMAQLFQERNDPKKYLEKNEKTHFFTKFKNQY